MESVQARYKIYGPCAVIPEPRRSVSQSFDQNQAQAPTGGTASGDHRKAAPVLPQLATETAARASEPWCVIHDP